MPVGGAVYVVLASGAFSYSVVMMAVHMWAYVGAYHLGDATVGLSVGTVRVWTVLWAACASVVWSL